MISSAVNGSKGCLEAKVAISNVYGSVRDSYTSCDGDVPFHDAGHKSRDKTDSAHLL